MPLPEAAILAYKQKQPFLEIPLTQILIIMLQASFVPILKALKHLAQFLHMSAVLLKLGQSCHINIGNVPQDSEKSTKTKI